MTTWPGSPTGAPGSIGGKLWMIIHDPMPSSAMTCPVVPTEWLRLPVLQAGGFGASVDAFAWEPDPDASPPQMRLWLISLLGSQQAVKALWAHLVKGETATLSTGCRQRPLLRPGCRRSTRLAILQSFAAGCQRLPRRARARSGAVHDGAPGVPAPAACLPMMPPMLHYRFLNRRVALPLHPSWADWLWERALRTGEARALESLGVEAYRCIPDEAALGSDLTAAIRRGALKLPDEIAPFGRLTLPSIAQSSGVGPGMARLESVARAGYYPTPPRVAAAIAQHLSRSAGGARRVVRLLDPCAGTGEAAAMLAQSLGRRELRHRAERGAGRRRAPTARPRAAHVGVLRPPGERRVLLPLPEPAVRLRRREPSPRARLPDEPDASALSGRRARLPHSAASAGRVGSLPGEPLHAASRRSGSPIRSTAPSARSCSSRIRKPKATPDPSRPGRPGSVEPRRPGAASGRYRSTRRWSCRHCPSAMSCSPRSPSIRSRPRRRPDAAVHGSSLTWPSSSGRRTSGRSDR